MRRSIRLFLAGAVFTVFCVTAWRIPDWPAVFQSQFGASVLKSLSFGALGALSAVVAVLLLTLLTGRIYCSVLCPLGILQDLFMSFKRRFPKQRSHARFRWIFFAATVGFFLVGITLPLSLLLPSSNFFLIENNLGKGLWAGIVNSWELNASAPTIPYTLGGFLAALLLLISLAVLARWKGRIYCNTVCPVGTLLSLPAAAARFWIQINPDACVSCGACEKSCKSGCIDIKTKTVRHADCVVCMNCLGVCKFHAIGFGKRIGTDSFSPSRRDFLCAGAGIAGGIAAGKLLPLIRKSSPEVPPAMPPGAGTRALFNAKCVSCGLCIAACKGKVLTHSGLQYGIGGFLQPFMNFDHGFCEFECKRCMEVCPCGALKDLPLPLKKQTRIGVAHYDRTICIPYVDGTVCGACAEHCPVGALSMIPYKEVSIPKVDATLCIGCGACQNICPVAPRKAIRVFGETEQNEVRPPVKTENKKLASEEEFPF